VILNVDLSPDDLTVPSFGPRIVCTERAIQRLLVPAWGERAIVDIKRSDMIAIITVLADAGTPATARAIYSVSKAMFNWAIVAGKMPSDAASPCDRIKVDTLVGKQALRERILSDGELRIVWAAATKVGHPAGDLVRRDHRRPRADRRGVTRTLEHDVDALTVTSPITGNNDKPSAFLANTLIWGR
jgi:hypothetical protein